MNITLRKCTINNINNKKPIAKANSNVSYSYCNKTANSYNYKGMGQLAKIYRMNINFNGIERIEDNYPKHTLDNYAGCILGGAIGDAFGAKIESWDIDEIKKVFGINGLKYIPLSNGIAKITDDTQMSLFTAYALIRSKLKNKGEYIHDECLNEFIFAYQDWYKTQTKKQGNNDKGILLSNPDLFSKRFPGNACMESLSKDKLGSKKIKINDSAGAGALMRTAPIGLALYDDPNLAFELGLDNALLTHGNPLGYIPAAGMAYLIANIINGKSLEESVQNTIEKLNTFGEHGKEIANLIERAVEYSNLEIDDEEAIKKIGKGWIASEIFAIAIYSSLKYKNDIYKGIIASINNNGDSDTIGSLTGNILGAYLGEEKIKNKYKNNIELQNVIREISNDLYSSIVNIKNPQEKYNCDINEATIKDRREDDKFIINKTNFQLNDADIELMKSLPLKEAIKLRNKFIFGKN